MTTQARAQVLAFHQQALTIQQEEGDIEGEANSLNKIAAAFDETGDKRRALLYYGQALALAPKLARKEEVNQLLNPI